MAFPPSVVRKPTKQTVLKAKMASGPVTVVVNVLFAVR